MVAHPHTDRAKALIAEAMYIVGEGNEQQVPDVMLGSLLLLAATTGNPPLFLQQMIERLERAIATMPADVMVGFLGRGRRP